MKLFRIATRESALALWQTEQVKAALLNAGHTVDVVAMSTKGDEITDQPLASVGGKSLFVKGLEEAMFNGKADLAVHSLKDVPAPLPEEFVLAAVLPRGPSEDVLVANQVSSFKELPQGAKVGTCSARRRAQLLNARPDLNILPLRGNIQTRLDKLDAGEYDAIVLAHAGLMRLGLSERIAEKLSDELCLCAAGQGAIAIECLAVDEETLAACQSLHCEKSAQQVCAERALVETLDGTCFSAIGAKATLNAQGVLYCVGRVLAVDGSQSLNAQAELVGNESPEALGQRVGEMLLTHGAQGLLSGNESCSED